MRNCWLLRVAWSNEIATAPGARPNQPVPVDRPQALTVCMTCLTVPGCWRFRPPATEHQRSGGKVFDSVNLSVGACSRRSNGGGNSYGPEHVVEHHRAGGGRIG